jgi:hypothetical protein
MCDGREATPDGALHDVNENGNEIIPAEDDMHEPQWPDLDALLARRGELNEAQHQIDSECGCLE